MTIIGVDVGFTTGSAIVWGVFTDTSRFAGMLTGTYVGATAQATAVAGVGANALVGGSNHSVSLQPLQSRVRSDSTLLVVSVRLNCITRSEMPMAWRLHTPGIRESGTDCMRSSDVALDGGQSLVDGVA